MFIFCRSLLMMRIFYSHFWHYLIFGKVNYWKIFKPTCMGNPNLMQKNLFLFYCASEKSLWETRSTEVFNPHLYLMPIWAEVVTFYFLVCCSNRIKHLYYLWQQPPPPFTHFQKKVTSTVLHTEPYFSKKNSLDYTRIFAASSVQYLFLSIISFYILW